MLKASKAIVVDENFGPKEKKEKEEMPALYKENRISNNDAGVVWACLDVCDLALSIKSSVYPWAQGLCGAPDVPHVALECLDPLAEGNDVGVIKAPPVNASEFLNDLNNSVRKNPLQTATLIFKISPIAGLEVCWETNYINNVLYVELPPGILPEGSKESLVTLLEYAEEELRCKHVVLCINKSRSDRVALLRVFNFFGFHVLPPSHFLIRNPSLDLLHMAYTIEVDSDEDEDGCDDEDESTMECSDYQGGNT